MVGGACRTYGAEEKCLLGYDVETEWERSPWRHRRRWENNIKALWKEMRWYGVNWIHLAQDRGKRRDLVNNFLQMKDPCYMELVKKVVFG